MSYWSSFDSGQEVNQAKMYVSCVLIMCADIGKI